MCECGGQEGEEFFASVFSTVKWAGGGGGGGEVCSLVQDAV